MSAPDLNTLSGYPSYTSDTSSPPPPPPPKTSHQPPPSTTQPPHYRQPSQGPPPLPPPPPQSATPSSSRPHTQPPPQQPSAPPPPEIHEHWLPEVLLDKTSQQLGPLLENPSLLHSLSQTHPSLSPQTSPLPPLLSQTSQLATHLTHQHARLLDLRQQTQEHLLQLHALERQWRAKQAQLDGELAPWSAKSLYQRLREAEREGEDVSRGVEGSWLDGPEVGEREVEEWLRGWREGRVRGWQRRESRERWDEGRVGGWR